MTMQATKSKLPILDVINIGVGDGTWIGSVREVGAPNFN